MEVHPGSLTVLFLSETLPWCQFLFMNRHLPATYRCQLVALLLGGICDLQVVEQVVAQPFFLQLAATCLGASILSCSVLACLL
jgi:hypothetical protein